MENSMPINRGFIALLFVFGSIGASFSQKSMEQKLELLLAQGHYKMVYRKAGRLLMNPSYDQETYPTKLRQLAAQELAKNPVWAKRHALELEWLPGSTKNTAVNSRVNQGTQSSAKTQKLLNEAQKHLGVPYKEAGIDPTGFDCSGFTCYVFEQNGVSLPRRAADQYTFCQKIDPDEAHAGDLVFFSNGTQINHVGILISDKGARKQMIHASSSIGISVVVIDDSAYWSARVAGYGRIK
jgi:cell wall-associated NlpC family hydrolase